MTESWKNVIGYEGYYQVSDCGNVRTVHRVYVRSNGHPHTIQSKTLKPWTMGKTGHLFVGLYKVAKERPKTRSIHSLVLEAFVGPCPEGMECCHNDGNAKNNNLCNLRWDTYSNNQLDSVKHGTKPQGKNHFRAKIKEEDVPTIRILLKEGKRSMNSISKDYNVDCATIRDIRDRRTWKHVK